MMTTNSPSIRHQKQPRFRAGEVLEPDIKFSFLEKLDVKLAINTPSKFPDLGQF